MAGSKYRCCRPPLPSPLPPPSLSPPSPPSPPSPAPPPSPSPLSARLPDVRRIPPLCRKIDLLSCLLSAIAPVRRRLSTAAQYPPPSSPGGPQLSSPIPAVCAFVRFFSPFAVCHPSLLPLRIPPCSVCRNPPAVSVCRTYAFPRRLPSAVCRTTAVLQPPELSICLLYAVCRLSRPSLSPSLTCL